MAQKRNNGEQKGREAGNNRLNDRKEQCCDSEQLAFPSVNRRGLVRVGVVVCVCARAQLRGRDFS